MISQQARLFSSNTSINSSRQGFSLIEILIVLALIGVVATLIITNLGGRFEEGKILAAKNWVNGSGKVAIESYLISKGTYPTSLDDLLVPVDGKAPILERESSLLDPWKKKYFYQQPGVHNTWSFDLWAESPSGLKIGNWDE